MKWLFLLMLLSGCSHLSAESDNPLEGTWALKGAHCDSGKFGPVGLGIAAMIATGKDEEVYEVSGANVLWRVRERGGKDSNRNSYCETTYSAIWKVGSSTIQSSGAKFKSRKGVNGFQCYEPFRRDQLPEPSEHDFELKGTNVLLIHHHDPTLKMKGQEYHGCLDRSDLVYELVRE